MKLRNKKTGEIITLDSEHINGLVDFGGKILVQTVEKEFSYGTLAKLNEDWEDYTPAEPLIKDDKIRKAVRTWAEAESEDCYYGEDAKTLYNGSGDHIEFWGRPFTDLKTGEHYTIAELCGEEEE